MTWSDDPAGNPAADSGSDRLIGAFISRYWILARLGRGAMGVVYDAEDQELGRRVAIKLLASAIADDPVALDRFKREARAASALTHPHICTVHDIGVHEGQPYLVMERMSGQSLHEVIHDGGDRPRGEPGKPAAPAIAGTPLAIDRVLALGEQIADALDAAHRAGIVHRDLKPANLFVTDRGEVKILDFGIAKRLVAAGTGADEDHLTGKGVAVGTVAYMSPEQAKGEPVDARSDLFSFGVVLYEMLTGRLPFDGASTAERWKALLADPPAPPSRWNPAVPAALDRIVLESLEKDPRLRYQSAARLRANLKALRRDGGADEGRVDVPRYERAPTRGRRALGVAVLGAALVAGGLWRAGCVVVPSGEAHPAARQAPMDPEAHTLYLKGVYQLDKRTPEGFRQAQVLFIQAVERDPEQAAIHAGLAHAWAMIGAYSLLPPEDTFPRAMAAARRALERDPDQAEARAALALCTFLYAWKWDEAEAEFRRVTGSRPDHAAGHHWYAELLMGRSRTDEAVAALKRARELDPLSLVVAVDTGRAYFFGRRYAEARAECQRALDVSPGFVPAIDCLAMVASEEGRYDEAIARYQDVSRLWGSESGLHGQTMALARAGRRAEAEANLARLRAAVGPAYRALVPLALVEASLGHDDEAFRLLEAARLEHNDKIAYLKVDPRADILRADPRWAAFAQRVGLP